MLSKLLKYEMKATSRIFLPMFGILILVAIINRVIAILSPSQTQAPNVISMILYVLILVGMFVVTMVVIIQRFYKSLLSDEGYLMFTLPVTPAMHIVTKLLVSILWIITSTLTAFLSVIIIASEELFKPNVINEIILSVNQLLRMDGAKMLVFEVLLASLIGTITSILMIYAAMSVGHLANDHKILASLGAYVGLYTIAQTIMTLFLLIPMFADQLNYMNPKMGEFGDIIPVMHGVMWFAILSSLVFSVGYFILSNIILTKKLNLE